MSAKDKITYRGTVAFLIHKSDNYTVALLQPEGISSALKQIKYAGKVFAEVGDAITIIGHWEDSDKYGRTFQVTDQEFESDITPSMLVSWLTVHGKGLGIGEARAKKIAEEFGDKFEFWLENEPEQIAIFAQVKLDNIEKLSEIWSEDRPRNIMMMRLAEFKLDKRVARNIYNAYGGASFDAVTKNPYALIQNIDQFGFKTADKIARKLGWRINNVLRVQAGILYFLKKVLMGDIEESQGDDDDDGKDNDWGNYTQSVGKRYQGSTCLARMDIQDMSAQFLKLEDQADLVESQIDWLLSNNKLIEMQGYLALPYIFKAEKTIASYLKCGVTDNPYWNSQSIDLALDNASRLDFSQRAALKLALSHRMVLITGGAGTGKSTLIAEITKSYQDIGKTVALAAPTGKAARRLTEVVENSVEATTIHRLLGYNPEFNRFEHDEYDPLSVNVVIIDEVSMLDILLAKSLFLAIGANTALVLVGDHNQLPPVGPGALLRDILQHKLLPTSLLTTCHRQENELKANASAILEGVLAPTVKPVENSVSPWLVQNRWVDKTAGFETAVLKRIQNLFEVTLPGMEYNPIYDVQFLTAMKKGDLGITSINRFLQGLYQKSKGVHVEPYKEKESDRFYLGDKVIQTKNNYTLGVMNGYQGIVVSESPLVVCFNNEEEILIPNDCKGNLSLAYCITVHKSQGSEFACAVVIVHSNARSLLNRNWFYTACTRARKTCIILGDDKGLAEAVNRNLENARCTLLPLFSS